MNKKLGLILGGAIAVLIGGTLLFNNLKEKPVDAKSEDFITIEDRKGSVKVPKNPERVVVLGYSSVDNMEVLNEEILALPKASLPDYLEKYKDDKYIDLGSLKKFDIEKIYELKPELIIIENRQEEFYDELSKIAPTIMLGRDGVNHFSTLKNDISILGTIFEKEEIANQHLKDIDKRLDIIKGEVVKINKNALITMVYDDEITAFGKESRFGMIHNEFGFKESDSNITEESHGQTVSSEYVLSKNPEYLFVIDKTILANKPQKSAKEILQNELIQKTDAYKNNNIIYLDTKAWYLGGPGILATQKMLNEMESVTRK
ncbi:MAG: siderophore ABC transporter substrate-binding protein [Sarcina sp.]